MSGSDKAIFYWLWMVAIVFLGFQSISSVAYAKQLFCSERAHDYSAPYRVGYWSDCQLQVDGEWRDWRDVDEWRR